MLHEFVTANRSDLIAIARATVASRTAPQATREELQFGIPLFLDQLVDVLRSQPARETIGDAAARHGDELLKMGFGVVQVVNDYGAICQAVTQLASERAATITVEEFRTFNACLDDAIGRAVGSYQRVRDEAVARDGAERLGVLAHELRNYLNSAELAFDVLKQGHVGMGGSVAGVLERSLAGLRGLVDRSLTEVRLTAPPSLRSRIDVARLVEELAVSAAIEARSRSMRLVIRTVEEDVFVAADAQLLAAAIMNLLQNAFKYSHAHGCVSLRAVATADRVCIEVEDECGGLPPGMADELFQPFEQRSENRTGLGLGLTISRRSIEANGGHLSVRDLSGKGCVFIVELPRA